MTALLWILVIAGALHVLALAVVVYTNTPRPSAPRKPVHAFLDCCYTIGMGLWAMWLLAGGVGNG